MQKKTKVEFIPNHQKMKCWVCKGTGYLDQICNEKYACDACPIKPCKNLCPTCKGTGIFVEENYHLIYTKKNGQKLGFSVDGLK